MERISSRLNLSEEKQISCKEIESLLLVFLPGAWQDFTAVFPQLSSALYSKEILLLLLLLSGLLYIPLCKCKMKASIGNLQCLYSLTLWWDFMHHYIMEGDISDEAICTSLHTAGISNRLWKDAFGEWNTKQTRILDSQRNDSRGEALGDSLGVHTKSTVFGAGASRRTAGDLGGSPGVWFLRQAETQTQNQHAHHPSGPELRHPLAGGAVSHVSELLEVCLQWQVACWEVMVSLPIIPAVLIKLCAETAWERERDRWIGDRWQR